MAEMLVGLVLIAPITLFSFGMLNRLRLASSPKNPNSRLFDALDHFTNAIAGAANLDELFILALDAILQTSHASAVRIWIADSDQRALHFRLHRGLFPEAFANTPSVLFGAGSMGRAAESKRTIRLNDLSTLPALKEKDYREFVSIPLVSRKRIVGVLDIAARHAGELNPPMIQLLETHAAILALAIQKIEQLDVSRRRIAESQRMWQAGLEIADSQNYPEVLRSVVDHARELIGAEASALCMWDSQKRWWVVQGASGPADAFEVSVRNFAPRDGTAPAECPVVRFKYRQSHLDVPILHDGNVIGCLCIANQRARDFSDQERELLTGIADQAARAIDSARRLEFEGSRAATTERERLAREMHDTLAQLLGFVGFKSQAAREFLRRGELEQAQTQLDQLTTLSQELYADTRELILGLRTQASPMQGLIPALSTYIEWFEQLSGIKTTLETEEFQQVHLSPTAELQIIRVVQEALSNVRKHSHAQSARVRFERRNEFANISIIDDGRGFDPENIPRGDLPRFGLQSMRERVESIGGTLAVQSAPSRGTCVALHVPVVFRGE